MVLVEHVPLEIVGSGHAYPPPTLAAPLDLHAKHCQILAAIAEMGQASLPTPSLASSQAMQVHLAAKTPEVEPPPLPVAFSKNQRIGRCYCVIKRCSKYVEVFNNDILRRDQEGYPQALYNFPRVATNISPSGVDMRRDFTFHQFFFQGRQWWCTYRQSKTVVSPHISLINFSQDLLALFITQNIGGRLRDQFSRQEPVPMTVLVYEARFHELYFHKTTILPMEEERVCYFVHGLHYYLRIVTEHLVLAEHSLLKVVGHA